MKSKLLYIDVCILKLMAIFMVVVSHYYRFFNSTSSLVILKSIGFFGAALFAFFSGYLAELNKHKIIEGGYSWLLNKLFQVYIPFVIVSFISLFIYKINGNMLLQLFLGINDGVLWYVPFIMFFYCLFYIFAVKKMPDHVYIVVGILVYILLEILQMDSQWYTSIGALLVGLLCGKNANGKNGFLKVFLAGCSVLIFSILSVKLVGYITLKNLFTTMAGMAISVFAFDVLMIIRNKESVKHMKLISTVNASLYWLYLVHMKVGLVLQSLNILSVITYLGASVCIAVMMNGLYAMLKGVQKQEE